MLRKGANSWKILGYFYITDTVLYCRMSSQNCFKQTRRNIFLKTTVMNVKSKYLSRTFKKTFLSYEIGL